MQRKIESVKELVDKVISDGQLTRNEQTMLNEAILNDGVIDKEEKEQINRLMKMVVSGKIKVV